jgi:hypothetical protein
MSPFDVPPDEMGMDPEATDEAIGRILSGARAEDEWRDVSRFVQELQETVPASGLPSEDLHVAAMVETAHLLAEKGDPAVRPVSNAAEPATQASGLPKQRRKPMKWKLAKVLAPIAAVLTVFGGMAYAGALPRSVQHAVSHTAGTVGLSVPSGEDQQDALENDDSQGVTDDSVDPAAIAEDDQGENADDQGESSDTSTSSDDQGENDDSQGDNNNQGEDGQGDGTDQSSGDSQGDGSGDSQGDSTDQSPGDSTGQSAGDSTGQSSGDSQGGGGSDTSSGDQQGDGQD